MAYQSACIARIKFSKSSDQSATGLKIRLRKYFGMCTWMGTSESISQNADGTFQSGDLFHENICNFKSFQDYKGQQVYQEDR